MLRILPAKYPTTIANTKTSTRGSGISMPIYRSKSSRTICASNHFTNRGISNIIAGVSFVAWIILGLFAGFIGGRLVNKSGQGLIMDIVLGIVGGVVGGWLAGFFGLAGVSELNFYSIGIAVGGALV